MVAAAVVAASVVGAVATTSSANSAAKAETNAAGNASAVQQNQYAQTRADLQPYNTWGQNGLTDAYNLMNNYNGSSAALSANQVNNLLGVGGNGASQLAALQQTPGYQFSLSQGLKAAQNSAAARGLGVSGAAFKGAENYATGLAGQTYNNQVNNSIANSQLQNQIYSNRIGQYQNVASLGENAAAQTGNIGQQTAANIGNNLTSAGNAQAAASIAGGNAISGAANSIPSALIYNSLLGGGAGGTSGMYLPAPLNYTPYGA